MLPYIVHIYTEVLHGLSNFELLENLGNEAKMGK